MLEGDGGHIKELYRRGQAHEQLGTDRLGLAMKHYTGCSTCGTRAEDKAGSICRLHQPSSTAARAHQRAWPWTCSSSASMRFPWSRTFSFLPSTCTPSPSSCASPGQVAPAGILSSLAARAARTLQPPPAPRVARADRHHPLE